MERLKCGYTMIGGNKSRTCRVSPIPDRLRWTCLHFHYVPKINKLFISLEVLLIYLLSSLKLINGPYLELWRPSQKDEKFERQRSFYLNMPYFIQSNIYLFDASIMKPINCTYLELWKPSQKMRSSKNKCHFIEIYLISSKAIYICLVIFCLSQLFCLRNEKYPIHIPFLIWHFPNCNVCLKR